MSKTEDLEYALRQLNAAFAEGRITFDDYERQDARLRARQAEIRLWRQAKSRVPGSLLAFTGGTKTEPPVKKNRRYPFGTARFTSDKPTLSDVVETRTVRRFPSARKLESAAGAPGNPKVSLPFPAPGNPSVAKAFPAQPRLALRRPRNAEHTRRITLRRRVAASGMLPHQLAGHFTLGEQAALTAIAYEVMRKGVCAITWAELGDRAGVSRDLVRRTVHKAAGLGLLSLQERPRQAFGWKHAPSLVRILDPLWGRWLAKRKQAEGRKLRGETSGVFPGGRNVPAPDNGSRSRRGFETKEPGFRASETPQQGCRSGPGG